MINKTEILSYLKDMNAYKMIKINGQDKERLVFNNKTAWDVFGNYEIGVLNPMNDYTYEWLNSFLSDVISLIEDNNYDTYEELSEAIGDNINEWADSKTDVYTSSLTAWLADNNTNPCYLDEAVQEGATNNILMVAQNKAIQELFFDSEQLLIDDLKATYEEIEEITII